MITQHWIIKQWHQGYENKVSLQLLPKLYQAAPLYPCCHQIGSNAADYLTDTVDNSFSVDDKYKNVVFDADTESEGIAVHRDYQIYERLKNSTMGKKLDDLSTRVSASESNFVRGGIYFTSKIGNKLSKLTTNDFNECMKWVSPITWLMASS